MILPVFLLLAEYGNRFNLYLPLSKLPAYLPCCCFIMISNESHHEMQFLLLIIRSKIVQYFTICFFPKKSIWARKRTSMNRAQNQIQYGFEIYKLVNSFYYIKVLTD